MASGGHARSGPPVDPNSGRSDRRGIAFGELPHDGYRGEAPEFPLPNGSTRELDLWAWAWRSPQADAWSREPWRWHSVAMWVRTAVVCEGPEAKAADKTAMRQLGDDIGLSPAGLRHNGWTITKAPAASSEQGRPAAPSSSRDRFEVIDGGA